MPEQRVVPTLCAIDWGVFPPTKRVKDLVEGEFFVMDRVNPHDPDIFEPIYIYRGNGTALRMDCVGVTHLASLTAPVHVLEPGDMKFYFELD